MLTELPVCHSIECHGELWRALSCRCGVADVRSERIGQLAMDCSIGMGIDWANIIVHGIGQGREAERSLNIIYYR